MGVATGNPTLSTPSSANADNETIASHHLAQNPQHHDPPVVNDSAQDRDYLAYLARATNDAVRDWDVKKGQLHWPQGLDSLFGYDAQSASSKIAFWDERLHPGDHARIKASIAETFSSDQKHWSGEYRLRHQDGNYLLILERAFIVRDTNNRPVRFIGCLMDITARKQLQDQVSRSQKMEAFGQLAGGMAHDFNNYLTSILGYSDLLLEETGEKGIAARHVAEIRKAAGRASALTGQLLAFGRKKVLEPHVVEVNSIITNLERTLLPLLGENITVACHLHQDKLGAHIKADVSQLTQVIINLALNARDAMPTGGRLTLETASLSLSAPVVFSGNDPLLPGDYVVINVIDDGAGMSEQAKNHLFEPFFTTKPDGHSSGLGLATSYGIVCQSGGRIRVESELGKGTKIQIFLPRAPAPPPPSYRRPGSKLLPTGTESIIVVEDDVSVRHISVRILRNLGYDVIEAASCSDAQRLFEKRGNRKIHLLLTDMVMPEMSGRDFADWLRKVSPETKVVFVSGYLEESRAPQDQTEAGAFFLSKPFDPEQLATTIRHALDS